MSLELTNITVLRRQRVVLDEISLSVRPGEVTALVGPNGAGKSTLLGVCAGEIAPNAGSVRWESTDMATLSTSERALVRSYLRQEQVADVPFSVREVAQMGRHALQRTGGTDQETDSRIVADAMEALDVIDLADRPVRTLSGGERARVAIARTMVQQAPVVLLDEPTAALDLAHQERVMEQIAGETRWNTTVMVVVHDLNLAAAHAHRIVVVSGGSIVADGSPAQVLEGGLLSEVYRRPLAVIDHPFRGIPLVVARDSGREL